MMRTTAVLARSRRARPAAALFAALALSGCSLPRVPVRPPAGVVVTFVHAPLSTDFDESKLGTRRGESSSFYFREPFFGTTWAFGAATIEAAARAGNIQEVSYADYRMVQVLGIVGHFEVTTYGD